MTRLVTIIGSAPDATRARSLDLSNAQAIVAMNNAWQVREDWTHAIFPEDFDEERRPVASGGQTVVTHEDYVPANNELGGILYVGATMAFTTAAWALTRLQPDILAFIGCDMIYDRAESHFYGAGSADPLRDDPSLQSLEAKSERLKWLGAQQGCVMTNLSEGPRSRLTFPRLDGAELAGDLDGFRAENLDALLQSVDEKAAAQAQDLEDRADCFVETGDYWNHPDAWDSEQLARIDAAWLRVFQ